MPEKPHVTIVGAGMAGLTAALRLAERGYRITLFERAPYIGGQFGVLKVGDFYHEHCYHMFLNWYNNFWKIVDELGIRDRFIPRSTIKFSERGAFPTMTEVVDVGSPWTAWRNLLSGVLPIPDMYIYGYSLLDLAAQPFNHEKFLDRFSINGFMRSRWYGTDSAAQQYQRTLAKAFASPTYKTSAESYQNLIKFGFRYPSPMMWILQDNCYEAFLRPFEQRLEQLGCEIRRNRDVKRLVFDAGKRRITQLDFQVVKTTPNEIIPEPIGDDGELIRHPVDRLIMAVPPDVLGGFVDDALYRAAPEIGDVLQLHGEPMASFDLCFHHRLPDIPAEHVVLIDSKFELSFIDNSQIWPELARRGKTCLNVAASDFDVLAGLLPREQAKHGATEQWREAIKAVKQHLIAELRTFVPFDDDAVDYPNSFIQTNIGEHIFVNEVGSWQYRPQARSGIANLYLAGDFCRSCIDITTLEGAVTTGLLAAEALRQDTEKGLGEPIEIIEPEVFPDALVEMMKIAGMPYALGAKFWAEANKLWPPLARN